VRDGHHRISVARALGQRDVEAEVTVWQVVGPLPWEQPATVLGAAGAADQEAEVELRHRRVKDGLRLQGRFLPGLGNLLAAVWISLKARVASPAGAGA
jgi:hypothetical protein